MAIKGSSAGAPSINPRYLIQIGVFSAVYFVVCFVGGMLGFLNPLMMFVGFAISILINGTVIMLYLYKTPIVGAMTLLGFVLAMMMVATGHPWVSLIISPLLGFSADVIAWSGKFRSRVRNILGYAVMTLWYLGPFYPIFTNTDAYFADMAKQMGQEYASATQALVTPSFLVVWGIVLFILGICGGWLGTVMLRKHFVRAGIA